jgi:hypothetical protein
VFTRPFAAADREDARVRGQVAVRMGHEERGQQLAGGQVAGAAEDDHVEREIGGGGSVGSSHSGGCTW